MTGRGTTSQLGYFMDLLPLVQTWRIIENGQGCHQLPPTSTNHGVKPHPPTLLTNRGPVPALLSDTLISRIEPRPYGSIGIVLEHTFEYWSQCRGTRITHPIMQGIWYKYNLSKEHTSDIAAYELCILLTADKYKFDRQFLHKQCKIWSTNME
jgi:hypothetical protein